MKDPFSSAELNTEDHTGVSTTTDLYSGADTLIMSGSLKLFSLKFATGEVKEIASYPLADTQWARDLPLYVTSLTTIDGMAILYNYNILV